MASNNDKERRADGGAVETRFAAVLAAAAKRNPETTLKLGDFTSPPITSVDDLIEKVDAQNERFTQFREKRHAIFGAMATALKPIEMVGEVVSGAASEVFAPSSSVFSAAMYLVNAANDVSSTYDNILQLFEKLKDFTSRLDVYTQHDISPALQDKIIEILATLFEVFVLATNEIRRGRFKAYLRRLVGSDSPAQEALERLESLTLGEERQVVAETHGGVSQINTKTDEVQATLNQVNRNVQWLRSEQRERSSVPHRDQLRDILEPSPFPVDFANAFARSRVNGTGDWILQDEGLKAWLNGETKFLWINGSPGTGKSFLTSRLISWGSNNLNHVGYFFFRNNNPETRSVLQALRDVAYQLSETDAFYAKQLMDDLRSSDDIKTVASAFRKLFVQPMESDTRGRTMYIFLDGIDEIEPDGTRLLLSQLAIPNEDEVEGRSKIQIALVGRSYLSETVTFALDPEAQGQIYSTLHITPERVNKDVSAYIADGIRKSRVMSRTAPEFKAEVIKTMEEKVDGLFILAKFMLADVNRKRHPRSILQSFESYPQEINGMLFTTVSSLVSNLSAEELEDLKEMLCWVCCAEEALTLEQLEAALVLRFGDPPFRLEEALRGQYSCFFELEREDGFTTDDLIKDWERQQRDASNESSPRGSSPNSKARNISPAGQLIASPPLAPYSPGRKPSPRQLSPARSPDLIDSEMEFRSNKATTYVTFFHASIRDFFRMENTETNGFNFSLANARLHTLKTCLRIFNDKKWLDGHELGKAKPAIQQYAAWYWQEHLRALDPAIVPVGEKKEVAKQVYRMLTDDDTIFDWSIKYEKNNEGLQVLSDDTIHALQKWISDPDVCAVLEADPESKEWVDKAVKDACAIAQPIGTFYARAWLDEWFAEYVPTAFCFKIVQSMAYLSDGLPWSHSRVHWQDVPLEERIAKATDWAGFDTTAHWHRRVGSTFLTQGLHKEALSHYEKAYALDHNGAETSGRIAYCLTKDKQYDEALTQLLEGVKREEDNLAKGTLTGAALARSHWRFYKDHFLIAQCYYHTDAVDKALGYYQAAMALAGDADLGPSEKFEAAVGYLEVLAAENRHAELMGVLQNMSLEVTAPKYNQTLLVDLLLDQCDKPLGMEWIPKAAVKANQVDLLLHGLEAAIMAAFGMRNSLKVMYLRLSVGALSAYGRNTNDAIDIYEQISLVEYRHRGNVPTRQGHAISFQRLAALYKQEVLRAGVDSPEAGGWIDKLRHVQGKQDEYQNHDMPPNMLGSDVNVASIYLALFYRLLGKHDESRKLLRGLIRDSLEILSDSEPLNDEYALENLVRLFIAADDVPHARALAQSMRRVNLEAVLATPTESPVVVKQEVAEPKLPEIQSASRSCARCLKVVAPDEEFHMCKLCMEVFCTECLDKVKGGEGPCESGHGWFVVRPLGRLLHRGEILRADGEEGVMKFGEWKQVVRAKYVDEEEIKGEVGSG